MFVLCINSYIKHYKVRLVFNTLTIHQPTIAFRYCTSRHNTTCLLSCIWVPQLTILHKWFNFYFCNLRSGIMKVYNAGMKHFNLST